MTKHSLSQSPDQRLVRNELLCYAATHVHSNTITCLTECLLDFYTPGEVFAARELLRSECEPILKNLIKISRRSAQAPTDKQSAQPYAEDITNWSHALDRAAEKDAVCFYALDLRKVPPCPPEEANLFSVVARIGILEKKFEENRAAQRPEATSQFPRGASALPACVESHQQGSQVSASQSAPASLPPVGPPLPAQSSNSWADVVSKNKRKIQERKKIRKATKSLTTITGKSKTATEVNACPPLKHIFVHKVNKDCTTDSISAFLKKKKIEPIDVRKTSKDGWLSSSFKVSLAENDFGKTFGSIEEFPRRLFHLPNILSRAESYPVHKSIHHDGILRILVRYNSRNTL